MSLYISSINSGSNGNCYYVGNHREAVLIDVGLSCRELEKRMCRLGLSMSLVKAIFISHEHSDHIRGLEVISRKFQLPVYISERTLKHSNLVIEGNLISSLQAHQAIQVGSINVTAFPKKHDAIDPHSFIVEDNHTKIAILTDIGSICEDVIKYSKGAHAMFLEANYDEAMLEQGAYPYYLKKRIRGGQGHLSNAQALNFFLEHKSEDLSHLILSHLSKDNNCPHLVQQLFEKNAGNTRVIVASRDGESAIYHINGAAANPISPLGMPTSEKAIHLSSDEQLTLF
jgi:phosphoribosyl 1,2-cyclic phosphodiesterase